jgi:glycosyltransferase involved in cell wall biosynthesis
MKAGAKDIVYLVGTSTTTRGGIGYVIGAHLNSDLKRQFRLIHIITHQDGGPLLKAATYAGCLLKFLLLRLTLGGKLVHLHSSNGPSFLRKCLFFFLSKGTGCRVVFQIHSGGFLDYYEASGRVMRFVIRYVLRASDHVVVLTASWKERMEKLLGDAANISVIGNPIDTSRYHPFPKDNDPSRNVRLLFLGALIRPKGVYDIVDCMRRLKGQGLRPRVTLAGDRELDQVRRYSIESGVEELIELPGWVSEQTKLELLKASDLLLLPSYKEGLPLCVLEAMACGLPVICTGVGGLGDLVAHGENGFIMVPGDSEAMAAHITKLVQDSSLREQMGSRNARAVQNSYSLLVIAQQVASLYWRTLERAEGGCHDEGVPTGNATGSGTPPRQVRQSASAQLEYPAR